MKVIFRALVFALICCGCAAFSQAQDQPGLSPDKPNDLPKIETKFDKAKNETNVEFRLLLIIDTETDKLLISVNATYSTQTPKTHPEDVVFIVSTLNKIGYRYPDVLALNIIADGQRLSPIVLLNLDKRAAVGEYYETLGTRMKYDVFMRVAKAKAVQMQFSTASFELNDRHLAVLHKFADLLHLD